MSMETNFKQTTKQTRYAITECTAQQSVQKSVQHSRVYRKVYSTTSAQKALALTSKASYMSVQVHGQVWCSLKTAHTTRHVATRSITTLENILPVHSDKGSKSALSCKSLRSFINCPLVLLRYQLILSRYSRRYHAIAGPSTFSSNSSLLFSNNWDACTNTSSEFGAANQWTLEVIAYRRTVTQTNLRRANSGGGCLKLAQILVDVTSLSLWLAIFVAALGLSRLVPNASPTRF